MAQPAKPILTLAVLICSFLAYAQDYSVGINTNNPNPNAVLHLVAPNGDQGLLIPQLTTSQRLQMGLGTEEDGLLVYDNTEGQFFYWHADAWHPLGSVSGTGDGNATDELQQLTKSDNIVTLSKSGGSFTDEVDDADADPTNELQTLSRSGNTISLSDGGSFTITEGSPVAGQSIQWDGENWIPLTPSTAQSLTLDGSLLSISGANTVDLTALNDGDGDSLNELQSLTLTADQLSLSRDGSIIDLAPYKDQLTEEQVDAYVGNNGYLEAELDPTVPDAIKDGIDWSELTGIPDLSVYLDNTDNQDLELTGDILSLTGDDTTVDLAAYLDNTDAQDLTLAGVTLNLSGDATPVDLSTFLDNTDNQDLTLVENSLTLSGDATSIDLTSYLDNTDEQVLSLTGNQLTLSNGGTVDLSLYAVDNVDDADADPANEIQDLTLSGTALNLSGDATPVDLSTFLQDLTLTDHTLSLSGDMTSVDLSGYLDNTDAQILSFSENQLSLSNGGTIDLSAYAVDNVDDADADPLNEIQDLTLSGTALNLSGDATPVDLSTFLQDLTLSGNTLSLSGDATSVDLFDGDWISLSNKPSDLQDGKIDWSEIENIPPSFLDGQDDILNSTDVQFYALQDNRLKQELSFSGGVISLTGSSTDINLTTWDLDRDKTNELITDMYVAPNDSLYIIEGGSIIAADITTSASDRRLKKEITGIKDALIKIQKINGYNYYLKSDSANQNLKTGVIAQEIEEIFPSIVKQRDDGYKGVTYQELIPILIEALKEQQALIDNLKSEVATLQEGGDDREERITALEGKLELIMNLMTK